MRNRILKYIFSLAGAWLFLLSLQAQTERIVGLRAGYDVSKLMYYIADDTRRNEFEISLDMEAIKNHYPVLEFGKTDYQLVDSAYTYSANGYFFRVGADRNFLKKLTPDRYEMLFGGLRYGYSRFSHSAWNITIEDGYWGGITGGIVPETDVSAHWVEVTGGIRGEIVRNLFIGWSFRARLMLHQTAGENMSPFLVPGFGNYSKSGNIGFTYTISYRIPLYKRSYSKKE